MRPRDLCNSRSKSGVDAAASFVDGVKLYGGLTLGLTVRTITRRAIHTLEGERICPGWGVHGPSPNNIIQNRYIFNDTAIDQSTGVTETSSLEVAVCVSRKHLQWTHASEVVAVLWFFERSQFQQNARYRGVSWRKLEGRWGSGHQRFHHYIAATTTTKAPRENQPASHLWLVSHRDAIEV